VSGRDRQNLLAAGAAVPIIVLAVLLAAPRAPRPERESDTRVSTLSAEPSGARAIYLVLERFVPGSLPHNRGTSPSVERWIKPMGILEATEDPGATLLVMQPREPLDGPDADALDRWVRRGGHLLLAVSLTPTADTPRSWVDLTRRLGVPLALGQEPAAGAPPLRTYRGEGGSLELEPHLLDEGNYLPLLGDDHGVVAARAAWGAGSVTVLGDGYAWSNERLAGTTNAVWLVHAVLARGNGRLLVDEYHQGAQGGRTILPLVARFLRSPWGLAVLQVALAGSLHLTALARRFGPMARPGAAPAADAWERVRGIASVLEAARARAFALQAITVATAARLRSRGRRAGPDAEAYLARIQERAEGPAPDGRELLALARGSAEQLAEQGHAARRHR
jgi:hypothetical protein